MVWSDEHIRRAKELASGPLARELGKMPLPFAVAVLIAAQLESGQIEVRTATATLVDTGTMPLAVSCQHVLAAYRNAKSRSKNLCFQIGGLKFDPETRLVAESMTSDLATFSLCGLDLSSLSDHAQIGSSLFSTADWPPSRVTEGDVVSLGGFPERWREYASIRELIFPTFCIGTVSVRSVANDQFGLLLEREYWVKSFNIENREELRHFSGLSGSPVIVERGGPVHRFEVVGIAKEFSESLDYVAVAHMDLVRADGTLTL